MGLWGSLLQRCIRSNLVVFSVDLIITLDLGVKGNCASRRGSKFNRVFNMRLEVPGLVRTRIDKQFKVASTIKPSLLPRVQVSHHFDVPWDMTALTCSREIHSACDRGDPCLRPPMFGGPEIGDWAKPCRVTHRGCRHTAHFHVSHLIICTHDVYPSVFRSQLTLGSAPDATLCASTTR